MIGIAAIGLLGVARAQSVVEPLTEQVTVDWTNLSVEVRGSAQSPTVGSLRTVEELARRNVTTALERALPRVPITATMTLGEVAADPALGPPIAARRARWEVTEARYTTSGEVTLIATLSLASVVKPWVLANTIDVEPDADAPFTGVLVDARAIALTRAVAPRIVSDDGVVVFDGVMDAFSAVTRAPVRYVGSLDEALERVGSRPWRLLATGTQAGVDLVVADVDRATAEQAEALVRTGEIVVVVRDRR